MLGVFQSGNGKSGRTERCPRLQFLIQKTLGLFPLVVVPNYNGLLGPINECRIGLISTWLYFGSSFLSILLLSAVCVSRDQLHRRMDNFGEGISQHRESLWRVLDKTERSDALAGKLR